MRGRPESRVVDEDAGNVTLPGPPRTDFGALRRAAWIWAPIGALNRGHVIQTSEEGARKSDVLGVFVTRSVFGDGTVAPPCPPRDPSSTPRTPGRLGHGHSLPGPWARRPRPFRPAVGIDH